MAFEPKFIKPLKVYIAANVNNVGNEKNYTTEKEAKNNLEWCIIIMELLHITKTN